MCSINDSAEPISSNPMHIGFEAFMSPMNNAAGSSQDQLIVYAAPVIQMQLSSRSKETLERLKEIKKEKSFLLAVVNPKATTKSVDDSQQ